MLEAENVKLGSGIGIGIDDGEFEFYLGSRRDCFEGDFGDVSEGRRHEELDWKVGEVYNSSS